MATLRQLLFLTPLFCLLLQYCAGAETDSCQDQNSYLWKIETSPPVYLFGTMHVPYKKLWQFIPENAKTAFNSCDEICLEIVPSDQDTRQVLTDCQYLPGYVDNIEQVLSKSMLARIEKYLESVRKLFPKWIGPTTFLTPGTSDALFNGRVNDWKKKRPIWILMMLSQLNEESIQNRNVPVLDVFMENAATELGKQVQPIESAKEHCRPLNKLDNSHVELALRVQLDYLEDQLASNELSSSLHSDILTYRCGDFAELISRTPILPIPPLSAINKTTPSLLPSELAVLEALETSLWNQLVVRRNRRMARAIDEALGKQRDKAMFIALGAGHYTSENSVVDRLAKKGHNITHVAATAVIEGPALPSNILQLGDPNTRLRQLDLGEESDHTPSYSGPTLSPQDHSRIWARIKQSLVQTTTTQSSEDHDINVRQAGHSGTSSIYSNSHLTTILLIVLLAMFYVL